MSNQLSANAMNLIEKIRLFDESWNLPGSKLHDHKGDLQCMVECFNRMAIEAKPISQDDAKDLAALLKQVGVPYSWIFARFKVSRAGELTNAHLTHIRENIQAMANEYRKETVTVTA